MSRHDRRGAPVRRTGRLLAVLAALAGLLPGLALGGAAPARAQGPEIAVTVSSLDPIVPKPGDTLRISGQVTNLGNAPISDVQIRLRMSPVPLLGRSDVGAVASGHTGVQGQLVYLATPDTARRLDPGGQATWSISTPFTDLPLGREGVYVLVVEAVGTLQGSYQQLGVARTFLPWVPVPAQVIPSHVVWLWPLTAPPTSAPDGVLVDDTVAGQLAPTGRLGRLVALGAVAPDVVSWVVDPQLLEAAAAMSKGYRVATPTGQVEGSGALTAGAWLTQAGTALASGDVHALPYGYPDADALVRAGLGADLTSAITLGQQLLATQLTRAVPPALWWPASGTSDRRTYDAVQASGVTTAVLPDTTLPTLPTQPYTSTGLAMLPTIGGSLHAVLGDSGLTAALDMPTGTPDQVLLARQRFIAELAMVTFEDPGRPRTVVVQPPIDWAPVPELVRQLLQVVRSAPFITPESLSQLLAQPADSSPRTRAEYSAAARSQELPAATLRRVAVDHRQLDALSAALSAPTQVTRPFSMGLLRTESSWWRWSPATGSALVATTTSQLHDRIDMVRIVSHGSVTLSGVNGNIPFTIANDFDQPVTVGLTIRGTPSPRLRAASLAPFTVPPHRKVSVEIDASLAGSAPLSVAAQLVSSNGEYLGDPVHISLRSSAYARAAKYVVVAAFLAMVLLLLANFVRRRRGERT